METIKVSSEYFSVKDTLLCGQFFRFKSYQNGYLVFAEDKCAYCYEDGDFSYIICQNDNKDFFTNFFDLSRDYSLIYNAAIGENVEILSKAANCGKGIRILNQNSIEALITFIVSQNNNIPRIKGIIERLCSGLGEKKSFLDQEYFAFPTLEKMAAQDISFYQSIGLGYRAAYVKSIAERLTKDLDLAKLDKLQTEQLKKELVKLYGVGEKVANCVLLFGFHRSDSFPVDTWIEKVYAQDFGGKIKNRIKITEWFLQRFKENSGYFQQYLFHYKRIKEKNN